MVRAEPYAPFAATTLLTTCASSYQVVGAVSGGAESESIQGVVFTDTNPFECNLASSSQAVVFNFNSTVTDPVTSCTYTLARTNKVTEGSVGSSVTLSCANSELHYGVTATPVSTDPDCNGLSPIVVDPKITVTTGTCTGG